MFVMVNVVLAFYTMDRWVLRCHPSILRDLSFPSLTLLLAYLPSYVDSPGHKNVWEPFIHHKTGDMLSDQEHLKNTFNFDYYWSKSVTLISKLCWIQVNHYYCLSSTKDTSNKNLKLSCMPNILAAIPQSLKYLPNFSWQSGFSKVHLLSTQLLSNKSNPMISTLQNSTTGADDSDTGRDPQMFPSQ